MRPVAGLGKRAVLSVRGAVNARRWYRARTIATDMNVAMPMAIDVSDAIPEPTPARAAIGPRDGLP